MTGHRRLLRELYGTLISSAERALRLHLRLCQALGRHTDAQAEVGLSRPIERVGVFLTLDPQLPFGLGDHLMAQLVLKAVRTRFPAANITLIMSASDAERYRELHYTSGWIDDVLPCPPSWPAALGARLRFARSIRRRRFQLTISGVGTASPLLLYMCGVPYRMGYYPTQLHHYRQDGRRARYLNLTVSLPAGIIDPPWTTLALAYARRLGFESESAADWVPYHRFQPERLIQGRQPFIVIHAGGSRAFNRRWPREHYLSLCLRLTRELHASLCLVGAEEDRETNAWLTERVRAQEPSASIVDATGVALNRTANYLAAARLFVGNDSGPMHMAVALGTRVVAIFGPTDPRRLGPNLVDPRSLSLSRGFPCRCALLPTTERCRAAYNPEQLCYPTCLGAIGSDEVFASVNQSLSVESALPTVSN